MNATATFKKAIETLRAAEQARLTENLRKARQAAQQVRVRFA
jgi:hypothetical protein